MNRPTHIENGLVVASGGGGRSEGGTGSLRSADANYYIQNG